MQTDRITDSITWHDIIATIRRGGLEARHAFNRAHGDALDPEWEAIRGDVPWADVDAEEVAAIEARYLRVVDAAGLA